MSDGDRRADTSLETRLAVIEVQHHAHDSICGQRYQEIGDKLETLHRRISTFKGEMHQLVVRFIWAVLLMLATIIAGFCAFVATNLHNLSAG
jgi:type IV secretory pathway TrbL component